MSDSFIREELYDLVWSEPVRSLAEKRGISDVAFAKVCRKHDTPLPPRGHWAKLQAGKKTFRQPLPRRGIGMPQIIRLGADRWSQYPTPRNLAALDLPLPPTFEEPVPMFPNAFAP